MAANQWLGRLQHLGRRTTLTLPLISIVLACLVLPGHPPLTQIVVGAVFLGLAAGGAIPAWGALIGSFFGRHSFSLVMGLMNPMLVTPDQGHEKQCDSHQHG